MKTNKLIKEAEAIGFEATLNRMGDIINLEIREKQYGGLVAYSAVNKMFIVGIHDDLYYRLEETKKQQLFKLLTEYASTPIEEREEEPRYKYRLPQVQGLKMVASEHSLYLNCNRFTKIWSFSNDVSSECFQTIFTHSELKSLGVDIEQLQEVYEEIEVEE